jgi:hypothetical protein
MGLVILSSLGSKSRAKEGNSAIMQGKYLLVREINAQTVIDAHTYIDVELAKIMHEGKRACIKVEEWFGIRG